MKKHIFLLPLVALGLFAQSCVEDEGNYSYKDINEVTIEDENTVIEVLSYIDRVKITPEISGTLYGDNLDNYEFKYTLCHDSHTHQVIGTEKDLDWLAEVKPGSYNIYFTVKDKNTGVETITRNPRRLSAKSPFSTGFLVLGENLDEGRSQVDMLAIVANRDTAIVPDVFDRSEVVLQNARKLFFTAEVPAYLGKPQLQNLWVMTDRDAYEFTSGENFELQSMFNDRMVVDPSVPVADPMVLVDVFPHQGMGGVHKSRQFRGYLTEDMLYYGGVNYGDYHTQPINRYASNSQTYFKPSPYIFYNAPYYSTLNYILGYDLSGDRFFMLPKNTDSYSVKYVYSLEDSDSDPWKYNAYLETVPRTIVYGENTFYGTTGCSYAIMKDKEGSVFYIYKMSIPSAATGTVSKEFFPVMPELMGEFAGASHYAFSSFRSAVFFSVGNRLYQYDFSYGRYVTLDFDDEIVYVGSDVISDGQKDEFFVCTYSDANKGTIYKYTHTDNPNTLDFRLMDGEEWHTDLRVTDITWKDAK